MLNHLIDVSRDLCASCTQPVSVFKQSFERAERGIVQTTISSTPNMSAQATLNNDFNG